jgi:hypothetical protein
MAPKRRSVHGATIKDEPSFFEESQRFYLTAKRALPIVAARRPLKCFSNPIREGRQINASHTLKKTQFAAKNLVNPF